MSDRGAVSPGLISMALLHGVKPRQHSGRLLVTRYNQGRVGGGQLADLFRTVERRASSMGLQGRAELLQPAHVTMLLRTHVPIIHSSYLRTGN